MSNGNDLDKSTVEKTPVNLLHNRILRQRKNFETLGRHYESLKKLDAGNSNLKIFENRFTFSLTSEAIMPDYRNSNTGFEEFRRKK